MDLFQMLIGLSGSLHPLANSDFFNAPSKTGDSNKDKKLYREARRRKVVESMGSRFTQEMVRIISSDAPAVPEGHDIYGAILFEFEAFLPLLDPTGIERVQSAAAKLQGRPTRKPFAIATLFKFPSDDTYRWLRDQLQTGLNPEDLVLLIDYLLELDSNESVAFSRELLVFLESGRNQDPNVQREILLLKIHVERSNA